MSSQIVRRATVLIPSYFQGKLSTPHLHVVMCDPNPDGFVLLVSVSTYEEEAREHDPTCLLNVGDHPFIKHTSYIAYQFAQPNRVSDLEKRIKTGVCVYREHVDEIVYQRILNGFRVSRFVKQFTFEYLPQPSPFR